MIRSIWIGGVGVRRKENLILRILKISGGRIFWNEKTNIGQENFREFQKFRYPWRQIKTASFAYISPFLCIFKGFRSNLLPQHRSWNLNLPVS